MNMLDVNMILGVPVILDYFLVVLETGSRMIAETNA